MSLKRDIKLFCGTATPELAQKVALELNQELSEGKASRFPDGETHLQIGESIRGADCYIIQSTCGPVNHHIMELLIFADALKTCLGMAY